ncbi:hypothetical protein C7M61_003835 [Candidozyma pseudohaemuli]|uniref:Uncharacterized protein n=1 Tax=Candidozyma pseudohaemuli TaxID=418784 RepID=A0A2P7YLW5_9ASCO|nr:hypothetical protein C7M61_003835 [[Candida] pseudohaemulonii]PSK36970.1 hypothetical protein C7M61_003835 [[Candida] pseudohaemulonii]
MKENVMKENVMKENVMKENVMKENVTNVKEDNATDNTMIEEMDLEAQRPTVPETTTSVSGKVKHFFKKFYTTYKNQIATIPAILYMSWLVFYITFMYRSLYITGAYHEICEYDSSLVSEMSRTVNALEKIIGGSTKNVGQLLPDQWPHGFYTVTYSGVCRENDNSEKVCYKGPSPENLLLIDVGVQIAEFNKMENPLQFGQKFMLTYRDLQDKLRLVKYMKPCPTTLTHRACWYDGLTNDEILSLPGKVVTGLQLISAWMAMTSAAVSLILLMMGVWMVGIDPRVPLSMAPAFNIFGCVVSFLAAIPGMEALYLTARYFDIRLFTPGPTVPVIAFVLAIIASGHCFWLVYREDTPATVNPTVPE